MGFVFVEIFVIDISFLFFEIEGGYHQRRLTLLIEFNFKKATKKILLV